MAQPFDASGKTIEDLFHGTGKKRLVIPPFQRGYSWDKKHYEALWRDLNGFLADRANGVMERYFLGPVVLLERNDYILVLDGQQRFATATMIFAALRDAAKSLHNPGATSLASALQHDYIGKFDAGDFVGWTLELGSLDKMYFQNTVQEENPIATKITLKSHRNIRSAFTFFKENLALRVTTENNQVVSLEYIKKMRDALRLYCVLTCIPVSTETEAFRIFETLNDRGLRLSPADLLLNFLMQKASDADRVEIRNYWDQMLEAMGTKGLKEFLRDMWVSKFGDLKNVDLFTALKQDIEKNNSMSMDFARVCSEECDNYRILLDADTRHLKSNAKYVRTILKSLDCDTALPLLLSAYPRLSDSGFKRLLRLLIVFIVRWNMVGKGTSGMEDIFYRLAKQVRTDRDGKEIKKGQEENKCITSVKKELEKSAPDDPSVQAAIANLILSQDFGSYVADRIANYYQSQTKEVALGETSLEHIFPKKPSADWTNVDDMKQLLWHIGNLVMLGEKLNGKAANAGYAHKKTIYAGSELKAAQEIASLYTDWKPADVESRANHLIPTILGIWDFGDPTRV